MAHTCELGVPQYMCVACLRSADAEHELKVRDAEARILFDAPDDKRDAVRAVINAAREVRDKHAASESLKQYYAIKAQEEQYMLDSLKTASADVSQDRLAQLRASHPTSTEVECAATADKKHCWTRMRTVGFSWHGAVLARECVCCGYEQSNH